MKKFKVVFAVVMIFMSGITFSQQQDHQQDIHKYITYQAWELVKHQHPEVINSEMSLRMGNWDDGSINGNYAWHKGKVITGAYREDEEDVVFKHGGPFTSATHFWDADNGDYATYNPPPFTHNYANSYQKMLAFWYGNLNNNGWLELGRFEWGFNQFYVRVKFNNLASAYKNHNNFLVTHWRYHGSLTWFEENPPQPLIPFLAENTTGYSYQEAVALINRVCWEIVGRMCHHIEDSGVPAHAHNDTHIISDYYESIYMPQHFQEYTWEDAAAQGGLIDINNKSYPLRYSIYTTNQIADRFRSDDACGDLNITYPSQYSSDNYESILNPVYNSVQNIGVCEGPESIMQTVAEKSFVYTIRSVAGFLWYVYNQFDIQSGYPPQIHGFNRNIGDNNFYLGETFKIECIATGTDLNYEWFYKVCDISSFCNAPIYGLNISDSGKYYNIKNNDFRNSWTCDFYDSLCRTNDNSSIDQIAESLEMFVGVKVSNQYGEVTRYFGMNQPERIYPKGFIRPPVPPITGCPVAFTLTDEGYIPENNILNKSTFFGNQNMDITDKIILKNQPVIDATDKSLNIAITETAGDIDHFDEIKLVSIDHPSDFILAVTENNDFVFIEESNVLSPFHAEKNGFDVTPELKYDSLFSKGVKGNDKDIIDLQFKPDAVNTSKQKFINELRKNNIPDNVFFNDYNYDSLAIILDPEGDVNILHTQKRPPGYISIYDSAGIKLTGDFDFTRRVRRAMTILPVQVSSYITNAQLVFKESFGLSYSAVAELIYIKKNALENDHELFYAEHSLKGEVTKYLLKEDHSKTVIDSNSFLRLKFRGKDEHLPNGWKRDYVLIIKGKTVPQSEDVSSQISNENVSDDRSVNINEFSLEQNYPNPFNPSTTIGYEIPVDLFVTLNVYDVLGRKVRELVNEYKQAGKYNVTFTAENGGSELPSGIYYFKISASGVKGSFEQVRKMMLVR